MRYLYKITNTVNNKIYIGQTNDFKRRKRQHEKGYDKSSLIATAIKKYGKDKFLYEVIEYCEENEIDKKEREAIVYFNCISPVGYNLESGGHKNKIQHQETKDKISKINKGRKLTPEQYERLLKNIPPFTEERRKLMSEQRKGKPNGRKGEKHSLEQNIKVSEGLKKYYLEHPEASHKLSLKKKGKKMSKESIEKRREGLNNFYKNMSPEKYAEYMKSKTRKSVEKRRSNISKTNTTGFQGVSLRKSTGKYTAIMTINSKRCILGNFKTAKEASIAYQNKLKELFGTGDSIITSILAQTPVR